MFSIKMVSEEEYLALPRPSQSAATIYVPGQTWHKHSYITASFTQHDKHTHNYSSNYVNRGVKNFLGVLQTPTTDPKTHCPNTEQGLHVTQPGRSYIDSWRVTNPDRFDKNMRHGCHFRY